jgi:hypothetical protein
MQRGQSTVEYLALVLLVLVAACALVRFHTPVEGMAIDLAQAVSGHGRPHLVHRRRAPRHHEDHRRPDDRTCLCPFSAQARPGGAA